MSHRSTSRSRRRRWSASQCCKDDPASVPVTLVINQGVGVKLTGAVNLGSPCLRNANLQLTVSGLNVVLAGSGPNGDSITFKGTVDSAGTQLTLNYILNASASGKCETDDGAGTLDKG